VVSTSLENEDESREWSPDRPLVETICGLNFRLLPHLTGPTIGLFWNEMKDEFPSCRSMPRLHQKKIVIGPVPEPRIWLLDEAEKRILQLQNDSLLLNWRRSRKDDHYPRFSKILEDFRTYLGRLTTFLQDEKIGRLSPTGVQMTYINQALYPDDVSKAAYLSKLFPDIAWRGNEERYLPDPDNLDLNTSFHLPGDLGRLAFRISSPVKPMSWLAAEGLAVRFDISVSAEAKGQVELGEIFEWFGKANQAINGAFQDLVRVD